MRKWVVASVVAASLASLPSVGLVASQGNEADIRFMAGRQYVALAFGVSEGVGPDGSGASGGIVLEGDAGRSGFVTAEDRRLLAELRKKMVAWHRYVLVDRMDNAELVMVIRADKTASVTGRMPIGGGQPGGVRGLGADVSVPGDMITVLKCAGGRVGALLWRARMEGGLSAPGIPLFEQFRTAIDAVPKRP